MAMNKKAFMFTLVTIFLIAIFVFVLYAGTSRVMLEQQDIAAERTEAIVLNLFTKSLTEFYLDTFVKVAATTALQAMSVYTEQVLAPAGVTTGIEDPEAFYREVMMNGTIASTYDGTATSLDFGMELLAYNNSKTVTLAKIPATSTAAFGNSIALVQRVALPSSFGELEHLDSIVLTIENSSATSADLYLVVYNATGSVVALDHQIFQEDQELYAFQFGGTLPLTPETTYDLMLAAPFTASDADYLAGVASGSSFDCDSDTCNMAVWDLSGTGTDIVIPLDFLLDHAVIGEGFLRQLVGSFEMLSRENMNIDTTINMTDIIIDEKDSWTIAVNTTFVFDVSRKTVSFSGIAADGEGDVSVIGRKEPYNLLLGYGNFIVVPQNVSDDFTSDDFYSHLSEHTFVFNEDAPSYLNRFAGEDADDSSCCGIQTVLTREYLAAYPDEGYSYVDHMFKRSAECNAETNLLYVLSTTNSDLQSIVGATGPYFDYASIEFYHLDEMSDVTATAGTCPNEGATE